MLNNLSYLFNILSCILSSIRLIYRMNEKIWFLYPYFSNDIL